MKKEDILKMTRHQCKMARAALGWSVMQLAEKSGVNKNTVVSFEKGKDIRMSTVTKLKEAIQDSGMVRLEGECCVCFDEGD